jgi:SAM-dependent methyltransferase
MVEKYIPGYSPNATSFMAHRSLDSHAAFFKPYLQSGMQLLDCGCGPGTITLGFAKAIAPGTVTGIDVGSSQISIAPSSPELDKAISYYKLLQQRNGGNPYVGRQLRALLREAGFTGIKASASYECYENLSSIADYLALRIEDSERVDRAVERGWTDANSLESMSRALREWSQHPDALFAQAWCEAVGQKG